MSTPALPLPRCQFCSGELKELAFHHWLMPAWVIMAVHCPTCHKVLYMTSVPIAEPEPSRVQLPS